MSNTKTRRKPIAGPSSDDREAWLAQRRQGVTATEVAKAAQGRPADIHKIITEKVTGAHVDLTGNKFVDYGNEREPIIADYVKRRFNIEPNTLCYSSPDNPRYLATPDGYVDDAFTEERFVAEIKTSRHDLWPFPFSRDDDLGVPTLTVAIADRALAAIDRGEFAPSGFWRTSYYDQIQWQMLVMNADRAIFAAEQHDDNWPNPKPLRPADVIWVERNVKRIEYLLTVADALLAKIDNATPDSIAPASEIDPDVADHMHKYLHAHGAVKTAEALKSAAWKWLQDHFKDVDEFRSENDEAKITWAAPEKSVTSVSDELLEHASAAQLSRITKGEQAVARADERIEKAKDALAKATAAREAAVGRLDSARKPFSVTVIERGDAKLTITAKTTKEAQA